MPLQSKNAKRGDLILSICWGRGSAKEKPVWQQQRLQLYLLVCCRCCPTSEPWHKMSLRCPQNYKFEYVPRATVRHLDWPYWIRFVNVSVSVGVAYARFSPFSRESETGYVVCASLDHMKKKTIVQIVLDLVVRSYQASGAQCSVYRPYLHQRVFAQMDTDNEDVWSGNDSGISCAPSPKLQKLYCLHWTCFVARGNSKVIQKEACVGKIQSDEADGKVADCQNRDSPEYAKMGQIWLTLLFTKECIAGFFWAVVTFFSCPWSELIGLSYVHLALSSPSSGFFQRVPCQLLWTKNKTKTLPDKRSSTQTAITSIKFSKISLSVREMNLIHVDLPQILITKGILIQSMPSRRISWEPCTECSFLCADDWWAIRINKMPHCQ